jgi:hypothetical protein
MRSATSLSYRHKRIDREGHVMIRRFGIRGLAVGLFAACAAMVAAPAAQADPTGAMSTLTAESGHGTGKVIVTPTGAGKGSFVAQVKVNIHDAAPNTTFSITRALAAPNSGCAPIIIPFAEVATLTTSAGGAGAVEFVRGGRDTGPNESFDLILRVVGSDGTVLLSGCMTIIGKPPPPT